MRGVKTTTAAPPTYACHYFSWLLCVSVGWGGGGGHAIASGFTLWICSNMIILYQADCTNKCNQSITMNLPFMPTSCKLILFTERPTIKSQDCVYQGRYIGIKLITHVKWCGLYQSYPGFYTSANLLRSDVFLTAGYSLSLHFAGLTFPYVRFA